MYCGIIFALVVGTCSAYWRMSCSVVQTGRIDPILSPNGISGHVHKMSGASNASPNSTYASLQQSNCSSCEVQADRSLYWTPQLYYHHGNGTFQEVRNAGMTVYYVGRGGTSNNTRAFPPGFRMISGDSEARSYDASTLTFGSTRPVADRVSFRCIDDDNDLPEAHYMFDTDCVNGMRAQVNFQSCWDGVNLYLEGSQHVAYLSGIDSGDCPPSFPVPIPGLFFEVLYWTNEVVQTDGGQFVFANGDTTGYGFHGDFLNGCTDSTLTLATRDCLYTDNGGRIDLCPILYTTQDVNVPRDCLEQAAIFPECVYGLINQLPGCNALSSGPETAPQVMCDLQPSFECRAGSNLSTMSVRHVRKQYPRGRRTLS